MSTLHAAMIDAINKAQSTELDALAILADNSGKVAITALTPSETITHSLKLKTDGSRIVHESDAIDYVEQSAAFDIIMGYGKLTYSLQSACASIIADFLVGDSRSQLAATDSKLWKALKDDCRTSCEFPPELELPSQWHVYFTVAKKALATGYPVASLITTNDEGIKQVRSRHTLTSFAASMRERVTTTVEDKIGDKLESIAASMFDTEAGFDVGSVPITPESKAVIKNLALAHIGRSELLDALNFNGDTPAEQIAALLDSGNADLMRNMLAAYDDSQRAEVRKVA